MDGTLTRRALLARAAFPMAAAAAVPAIAAPLIPPGDPETIRCVEAYQAAKAALADAYGRHAESDALMDPYQRAAIHAEERLISSILGNPAPDCVRRYYPTRGFVHAGRLYLAMAEDPDDEEMLRAGRGRGDGHTWVMGLRIMPIDAIEGLTGSLPRRPSPLPRPDRPELAAAMVEFRHAADAVRRLQRDYDRIAGLGVRELTGRFEETTWDPAVDRVEAAEAALLELMRAEDVGAVSVGGWLVADQVADVVATQDFQPSWTTTIRAGSIMFLD